MVKLLFTAALLAVLELHSCVSAHMEVTWPPPLRSKNNPHANGDVDFSMTSPLDASGSDFPCKGSLDLLGTEAAASVATFAAGQQYNLTVDGGANHNGGSCQASLSYDQGKTFTVIQSWVGNCPPSGSSNWDFTIPDDAPSADDAIFAWTWFNNVGNREMYMNCAVVTIDGSGGSKAKRQSSTSFSSRPEILVANVNNGCSTTEGSDVEFPNPGSDIINDSSSTAPPEGSCGSSSGGGAGGDGGNTDGGNTDEGSDDSSDNPSGGDEETNPGIPDPAPSESEQPPTTSAPGGIFLPEPSEEAGGDQGTTFSTVTAPVETDLPAPSQPPTVPETPGTPDTPDAPTDGGADGAQSGECSNEGDWNCVGGTQFQRCASGSWSELMQMAAGTSCEEGMSASLVMFRKRGKRTLGRRFMTP